MPEVLNPIPGCDAVVKSVAPMSPLTTLLAAYGRYDEFKAGAGASCPPKAWLFKRIAETIWPVTNRISPFEWHPWAERMNTEAHKWQYLGLVGCANCSKSQFGGLYALINWMTDPVNTLVLVTSTSIPGARKRIWSAILKLYSGAGGDAGLPGKLVDSRAMIRTQDQGQIYPDTCGIQIVAGEQKKAREAVGKLIGIKAKRLILIADELPELAESLLEAAVSNLAGNPNFQMIGLGNLFSMYDPLGTFVTPTKGWPSVNLESEEWETKYGYCLRFDGTKSPNVLEGRDIYPFLYKLRDLKEHRSKLGENSVNFWRMCRSFPPPIGTEFTIYSEADLLSGRCEEKVKWLTPPTPVAAMDPSFTTGGDRSIAMIGLWGQSVGGPMTLQFEVIKALHEDATKTDQPRSQQITEQFIDLCQHWRVNPRHAALDATAAGRVMHDLISEKWSNQVLAVEFGGAPSDLPANINGNSTCREAYDRRVSELWYAGLEFVRGGQIKGVTPELATEMKARRYDLVKGATTKVRVEPKRDMKERLGFSPDIADAAMVMIDLIRQRLGAVPQVSKTQRAGNRTNFRQKAMQLQTIYEGQHTES